MNKNRLSTNIGSLNKFNQMKDIDFRINNLLQMRQLVVWVYVMDKLVEGSPFLNITKACKAVGIDPRYSYLDNNKLVKKRFAFYSYKKNNLSVSFNFIVNYYHKN